MELLSLAESAGPGGEPNTFWMDGSPECSRMLGNCRLHTMLQVQMKAMLMEHEFSSMMQLLHEWGIWHKVQQQACVRDAAIMQVW